jgi:hypothetical protein
MSYPSFLKSIWDKVDYPKFLDKDEILPDYLPILNNLLCELCKGVFLNPVVTIDNRIFCEGCLDLALEDPERKDQVISHSYDLPEFKVKCPRKCNWEGPYKELISHLNGNCGLLIPLDEESQKLAEIKLNSFSKNESPRKLKEDKVLVPNEYNKSNEKSSILFLQERYENLQNEFKRLELAYQDDIKTIVYSMNKRLNKMENFIRGKFKAYDTYDEVNLLSDKEETKQVNYNNNKNNSYYNNESSTNNRRFIQKNVKPLPKKDKSNESISWGSLNFDDFIEDQEEIVKKPKRKYHRKSQENDIFEDKKLISASIDPPPKKKRGRPPKKKIEENFENKNEFIYSNDNIQAYFGESLDTLKNEEKEFLKYGEEKEFTDLKTNQEKLHNQEEIKFAKKRERPEQEKNSSGEEEIFLIHKKPKKILLPINDEGSKTSLDTENISAGISVDGLKATCNASNKNSHLFVFSKHKLEIDKDCEWKIILNEYTYGWIGLGACVKEIVINNEYKFTSPNKDFYHGNFLISSNGFSWNSNVPNENNKKIQMIPKFSKGLEISFSYSCLEKSLNIKFNDFSFTLNNVLSDPRRGVSLVPCVLFINPGDSVEFNFLNN